MPSFFRNYKDFINSLYALDIGIETYLKDYYFSEEPDLKRIIYASNEYAFRLRTDQNEGNLNLPFMNYHLKASGVQFNNDLNWRNFDLYDDGVFIDDLGYKLRAMPIQVDYEATFWCTRDDEAKYVATKTMFQQGSTLTPIPYSVQVDSVKIPLLGKLFNDSTDVDALYNEKDWLERNKIHSVGIDFRVNTFVLLPEFDVCIPDSVVWEFSTKHGVDESFTTEERYNFIVDHFNQTVIPKV